MTPDTADHNDQISEWGFELGGPLLPGLRDKAWVWGALSEQDIRLVRQASGVIDKTDLKNSTVKGTWKISEQDTFNTLWFLTRKIKEGRSPSALQRQAPTALWNQGQAYPDDAPRGLLKFENNHVFSNNLFVSGRWAYYGTGFTLSPVGGLDMLAGQSERLGETFGSINDLLFIRPEHTFSGEGTYFRSGWLGAAHELKFGGGFRRHDEFEPDLWPGNMIQARDNSATDQRARVHREGAGNDRARYVNLFVSDTITKDRLTLTGGVRYDRQWGKQLPSETQANVAFPELVPGVVFEGAKDLFTWNDVSPRVGATYALDDANKTVVPASFSRFAGQLSTDTVGFNNVSSDAGWVEFPWVDLNGDHLAQREEVLTDEFITFGGGFNPASPTAVVSANQIDPDLEAPRATSVVVGLDRELMPNTAVSVAYTYTRTTDFDWTPWVGLTAADYFPGDPVSGELPDGTPFNITTFVPDEEKIEDAGNSRILTNRPDYRTTFHGIDVTATKRMSDRWMARASFGWNFARQFFGDSPRIGFNVTGAGNPTRTDTDPLVEGGQLAERSAGSGTGDVFLNNKWNLSLNASYLLPWHDIQVAGSLFGKQGTPFPFFVSAPLGRDGSQRILVTEDVDSERFDNLWNLDLRVAKDFNLQQVNVQFIADLFNVFNSNTELNRERNLVSPNFNRLNSNLSPRIVRFGLRLGV